MRLRWTDALLALALAALPATAPAEDEQLRREMDEMRNMILQLQDTVKAQSGQIEQQREVIDRAGIEEIDGSASGVASFFEDVEIGGWLAVSYFHNLNDLDTRDLVGGNSGNGCCLPFHPDDNSFSFDQLWFEIGKSATAEDRAGFFAEIAFGRTAALLPGGNGSGGVGVDIGGNSLYLNSAYVEYLADLGGQEVLFKMGKFGTLIGYEVAQAPYNDQITRGNVYNLLQPIDHVGFLASTELGGGFDIAAGVINNFHFASPQPNLSDGAGFLGHVGYTAERWSISLNGLYGDDTAGRDEKTTGIADLVVTWDPIDRLRLWMNADYVIRDDDAFSDDPNAWGIALGSRLAWTERFGTALRYEFVDDDGRVFGCSGAQPAGNTETECQIHSLTLTGDFAFTDRLTVKAEVRYDVADLHDNSDDVFFDDDTGARRAAAAAAGGVPAPTRGNDQVVVGVEAIYAF